MADYVTNCHAPPPPPLRGFGPQVEHPNLTVKALLPSSKTLTREKKTSPPPSTTTTHISSSLSIKPQAAPYSPVPFNCVNAVSQEVREGAVLTHENQEEGLCPSPLL